MPGLHGQERLGPIGRHAHGVHEQVAVVGSAAVRTGRVERVVRLAGARVQAVPVALRNLGHRAALRHLADVDHHEVRPGRARREGRRGEIEKGPVLVAGICPQEHLVRLDLDAGLIGRGVALDELRVGRVLQAEEVDVERERRVVPRRAGAGGVGSIADVHEVLVQGEGCVHPAVEQRIVTDQLEIEGCSRLDGLDGTRGNGGRSASGASGHPRSGSGHPNRERRRGRHKCPESASHRLVLPSRPGGSGRPTRRFSRGAYHRYFAETSGISIYLRGRDLARSLRPPEADT